MTEQEAKEINAVREFARAPERVEPNGIPSAVDSIRDENLKPDWDDFMRRRESNPEQFASAEQGVVDYAALLDDAKAENHRLRGLLDAVQAGQSRPTSQQGSGTAAKLTAEQLSRKMKPYQLDRLSDNELAVSLGMTAVPTREDVARFFGPGTHVEANRLMNTDRQKYYQLRGFGQLRRWI
ncbi:hypothetical protein [Terriglobus sp. RCC_193]|uniref:hypothetical protein n=1 Tax=Terriglobus sp. RCC_193 TaxID=3239218 RepID=UPI003526400F